MAGPEIDSSDLAGGYHHRHDHRAISIGASGDPIGARGEFDTPRCLGQTLLVAHCLQEPAILGEHLVIGVKPAIGQIIEMSMDIEGRKHDENAFRICAGSLSKSGADPVQHERFLARRTTWREQCGSEQANNGVVIHVLIFDMVGGG